MAEPFLYYVAQDLIKRFGNNLSQVTIVFPGKRAELYMNSFLSHIAQGPVWAPRFCTIDELFQQFSDLKPSDNIVNVCRLYRIYAELVDSPESLDDFYGWGEVMMNDFNDIDKHMVPADKLFTNAADLARLDDGSYLTQEQVETLRQFFSNFEPSQLTELKRHFMDLWSKMPLIYTRLKEELQQSGEMYKGALYREVAERIHELIARAKGQLGTSKEAQANTYCFVGFNVLDEVEETLFTALRDAGQALFYWDYDLFYADEDSDHEAGLFLRHNLEKFPQALCDTPFDNLRSPDKKIRMLSTTTDNAQVRYLAQWLEERKAQKGESTAVVLCDEALMRSTMHAIPEADVLVNLTMGYPLTDTAIHGYFSSLIDLQVDGYNTDMNRFLPTALERVEKNPFFVSFPQEMTPLQHQESSAQLLDWLIAAIESLGKHLSKQSEESSPYDQLYAEATFQLYKILNKFHRLTADGTLFVRPNTIRRLIRQALASASIPFHGEMDEGVQIMGLLEARNLDFQHLVMLSVGEGIIPRKASDTSLIPYILRAHFGLDTTERQDRVYDYSFYRLLQRAQDITLVYNNNSSGASQREQSRFLRQLAIETDLHIEHEDLSEPLAVPDSEPVSVEKDQRVMDILLAKRSLSPSAINTYVNCPLQFYYEQVAHLRMPDRPQDGIDNARFGTIFHDTCEFFYRHLYRITGRRQVLESDLSPLFSKDLGSEIIPIYVNLTFWVDFFHAASYDSFLHPQEREMFLAPFLTVPDYKTLAQMVSDLYPEGALAHFTGVTMIIREVIIQLVRKLLLWDKRHTPFTIVGMEKDVKMDISIDIPQATHPQHKIWQGSVGGRIDRMDIMDIDGRPTLRIVDYKTGKPKSGPATIEDIFLPSDRNAHGYYLQTFLYALVMSRRAADAASPQAKADPDFATLGLSQSDLNVAPCLFYVLAADEAYDPMLRLGKDTVGDISDYAQEYEEGLRRVLSEIFDPTRPFVQSEGKQCEYCDFRCLCGR